MNLGARKPLALIVAVAKNGVIGRDGALPWRLPHDLRRFKTLTTNHAVIMGRKTFDSIGKPLPNRRNIVITSRGDPADARARGYEIATTLDAAITRARETDSEPFVIGGGRVYAEALAHATTIHLTEIDRTVGGDAFFPAIDRSEWSEAMRERSPDGEDVAYVTLVRR